jgi:DNA-binding transcriptional LysR family regulator
MQLDLSPTNGTLKVFCDVARCRSFSLAAQANGVTQSAASQIVSQLERRMGVQLIDRSTRPLLLTAAGQVFFDGCKSLMEQYTELEARLKSGVQEELTGSVQVAAIYSVGLIDMGQLVQRFIAEQPQVDVHINYVHPDDVYQQVLDGIADFGLVSFPRKSSKLNAVPWREEEMVLACAPKHALARQPVFDVKLLEGHNYIHFERNLTIRREVERYLREQDVNVNVVMEFDNIENIKQAVAIGAGVALLPEPTLRREVQAHTLVARPLLGSRLTRPLGIIYRRRPKLSAAAERFFEMLRSEKSNGFHLDGAEATFAGGSPINNHREQRTRNGASPVAKRS